MDHKIFLLGLIFSLFFCKSFAGLEAPKKFSIFHKNEDILTTSITEGIQNLYANSSSNYDNTVEFIDEFNSLSNKVQGYLSLFNTIKSNNDLYTQGSLNLAHRIKMLLIDMKNSLSLTEQDTLKQISLKFPRSIQNIENCEAIRLFNRGYSEYFFVGADMYNKNRRYTLTHRSGENQPGDEWRFYTRDNSKMYEIKNLKYSEYMYAPSGHHTEKAGRRSYTWTPATVDETGQWWIELIPDTDYIRIKSVKYSEYLFAHHEKFTDGSTGFKRRCFTYRKAFPEAWNRYSQWNVECQK